MNTNILNSNMKELYLTKVSKEDAARKAVLHVVDNPSISSALIDSIDWDTLDITYVPTYSYRISWKAHWSADIGHNYTVKTNGGNNRTETRWTSSVGAESGNETYTLIANRDRFTSDIFDASGFVMGHTKRPITASDNQYKFLEVDMSECDHSDTLESRVNNVAENTCRNAAKNEGDKYRSLNVSSSHSINMREQGYVPFWELIFKEKTDEKKDEEKDRGVCINAVTGHVGMTYEKNISFYIRLFFAFVIPASIIASFFFNEGPKNTNAMLITGASSIAIALLMYPAISIYRLFKFEKYINSKDLGFIRRFILWIYRSVKGLFTSKNNKSESKSDTNVSSQGDSEKLADVDNK